MNEETATTDGAPANREQQVAEQVTGARIVAALIDMVPLIVLFLLMAAVWGDLGSTDDQDFAVRLEDGAFIFYALLSLGYYVVLEGLTGATPGKQVMGLKVVKVNGDSYEWGAVILRNLLRIIDALPFLYLLGLVSVAVSKRNQRLGDLAAGTIIVRSR